MALTAYCPLATLSGGRFSLFALLLSIAAISPCPGQQQSIEDAQKHFQLLRQRRERVGAFLDAARKGDVLTLGRNIQNGMDVNEDLDGYSALGVAAERNQLGAIVLLLDAGARINSRTTENPLHAAARSGSLAAVNLLVERGADVNWTNSRNLSALNWAATWGHTEIVLYLMSKGANIHLVDNVCGKPNCRSAIHQAAYVRAWPAFVALVSAGANVNQQDETAKSGLHWAVYSLDPEIVKLVLRHGADVHLKDAQDRTARDLATYLRSPEQFGKVATRRLEQIIEVLDNPDAYRDAVQLKIGI